jgi:hypothetical protein
MSANDQPSPGAMSAAREILNGIFLPISHSMLEPYSPDPADVALCSEIIDRELAAAQAKIAELEQDKARLDWLESEENRTLLAFTIRAGQTYREGIDAARKEGQK